MIPSTLACALLASLPLAQNPTPRAAPAPLRLPVQHVGPTGGVVEYLGARPVGGTQRATTTCYQNATLASSSATITAGEEWVDFGDKGCALTSFIGGFTFGYATTALDPSQSGPGATLTIALYRGTTGSGTLGTEVFRTTFVGLPGSLDGTTPASFTVPVALFSPIMVPDGDLGWGYVGIDGLTGPLLVSTTGTCGGPPDPTTGTEDCFDSYVAPASPATFVNTFTFGGAGNASFYFEVAEHTGASSTSMLINGTGVNPVLLSEQSTPIPSRPWVTNIDLSSFPTTIVTVVGVSLQALPPFMLPQGELFIDPSPNFLVAADVSATGMHTAVIPPAPGLLGGTFYVQGVIVDPLTSGTILVNGIQFTLGL